MGWQALLAQIDNDYLEATSILSSGTIRSLRPCESHKYNSCCGGCWYLYNFLFLCSIDLLVISILVIVVKSLMCLRCIQLYSCVVVAIVLGMADQTALVQFLGSGCWGCATNMDALAMH